MNKAIHFMKAKKIFCVVAYDIEDNRRRLKISKLLEKYGLRVNYSVFECMFTEKQFEMTQEKIAILINVKEDSIVYYPICVNCFTRIVYQPYKRGSAQVIQIV